MRRYRSSGPKWQKKSSQFHLRKACRFEGRSHIEVIHLWLAERTRYREFRRYLTGQESIHQYNTFRQEKERWRTRGR